VTGRTPDEVSACQNSDKDLLVRELDATDDVAVQRLAADFDSLDVLVNAIGMIARDAEHDPHVFTEVINVNLNGVMRVCYALRDQLAKRKGAVVNLASMLSFFGSGAAPAYSASKGGVAQLTKSLAIAWAPLGIRVNAVAPGWIETALTAALHQDPARRDMIVERTPLGRWGQPDDVVGPVLFLCSPAAKFVTGAILPVDGGYCIR
jgi:NAD(P)-dependent dehydrogenase (short-subunit alcohol dehydrogenase family)